MTKGAAESVAWIDHQGLDTSRTVHWYVEISIPTESADTTFELNIYPEEWGVVFRRGPRVSSIRVTDVPFVHGLDEHRLLQELPGLDRIDTLLASLERRYEIEFQRARAAVRTNLVRATAIVRPWLVSQR